MRVTDSMFAELSRGGISRSKAALAKAQQVVSTGMRVSAPSDDPRSAALGRRKQNESEHIEEMLKTADTGAFALNVVDAAFDHMSEIMARARELSVQAANATLSPADRLSIGTEIASLREELRTTANTRVDGKYVLNGLDDSRPPYDTAGAFVGNRVARELEPAPGLRAVTSVPAGDVLSPTSGGVDVLAAFDRLHTALTSNDLAGIQAGIDDMAQGTEQVANARGTVGAAMQTFEMAKSVGSAALLRVKDEHAAAVEADPYDALSRYTQASTALERAVAIAARLPLPGLAQKG